MAIEFEGRVLDINYDDFVSKIKLVGGKIKKPLMLYKRSVFSLCDIKRGFVRVRDEGDRVMMTAKQYKDVKFPEEYELEIKDTFGNGEAFLQALGLNKKAYHETMRETWSIPLSKTSKTELCEIALDFIPALPLYAELECKTKAHLDRSVKLLGIPLSSLMYGGYGKVFTHYYGMPENDINNVIPSITFENITKELKPYIRKNNVLLDTVAKSHLTIYKSVKK